MMELINKCVDYLKANKTLAIILAAIVALVVIVVVALIVKAAKRSKAKKRAVKGAQTTAKAAAPTPVAAAKPTTVSEADKKAAAEKEAAEKEAARRAVLERLEAERIAAEKEEAEEKAKAEAEAKAAEEAAKAAEKEAAKAAKPKAAAKPKTVKKAEEKPAEAVKAEAATTETKPVAKKKSTAKPAAEKKSTVKPTAEKAKEEKPVEAAKQEKSPAKAYSGKWSIFRVVTNDTEAEEMYFFELRASNGEKLLSSEEYTSYNGVLKGIETHKANIEKGNFRITLSKKGDYIFKLLSGKNTLLCTGANYPTKARCESAVESTKRFAKTAIVDENVQDYLVKVPVEDDADFTELPDGYNGKWIIVGNKDEDGEEVFYFELFANNGEKLLSSEEYTSYIGAVNGIQTHKTNIEKGNFRISLTKRGDYIYKLLNGNGQLLCLGEHYKTKRRCQSAVESVKRFAKNSPVLTDPEHTK